MRFWDTILEKKAAVQVILYWIRWFFSFLFFIPWWTDAFTNPVCNQGFIHARTEEQFDCSGNQPRLRRPRFSPFWYRFLVWHWKNHLISSCL